jgi:hypothetical protein
MDSKDSLIALRVSVARLAQVVGAQTQTLPITDDMALDELLELAKTQGGWNRLVVAIIDNVQELQRRTNHVPSN